MEEDVASSMLYIVVQLSKSSYQQKKKFTLDQDFSLLSLYKLIHLKAPPYIFTQNKIP